MDVSNAWINGRTLSTALLATNQPNHFRPFSLTDRVKVDFSRDSLRCLGSDLTHAYPFVVEENMFVTAHDFPAASRIFTFSSIRFSQKALEAALFFVGNDTQMQEMEAHGRRLVHANPDQALQFSEAVCQWGRGHRVWANLLRHHTEINLGQLLCRWFATARDTSDPTEAITPGIDIKGLRLSFASKHLRMLNPDAFPVLDEVLHHGLGYALNPAGYNLFIRDLRIVKNDAEIHGTVAELEAAVFQLVRQIVRGRL